MRKLALVIVLLFLISGCFWGNNQNLEQPLEPKPQTEEIIEGEKIVEITIASVGDIMVHSRQFEAAYDPQTKMYNFENNFTLIKDYIKLADIAIANLETTFGGEERGYSGYPRFNTPDTMADALKYAGFDVISTINNHTMDTGIKGMFRTIEVLTLSSKKSPAS